MNTFIPITKVDETRREVWGIAAEEVADARGEMMDYELSKPNFQTWSEQIQKATNGASLGNVRAMHQPIAAGKLIDISYDDELKKILIGAKIVDDAEWKKVVEGVYTGFSIGGHYGKQKFDKGVLKYEAIPAEISIVDNPCMKGATFTMVKSDGMSEEVPFMTSVDDEPSLNLSAAVHSLLLERENLQKVGARNSKRDAEMIQAIHDHACSLGAGCSGKEDEEVKKSDGAGEFEASWAAWLASYDVTDVASALQLVSGLAGRIVGSDAVSATKLTQAASLISEALQAKLAQQVAATEAAIADQVQDAALEEQVESNAEVAPEPTEDTTAEKADKPAGKEEAANGDEEEDMTKSVTPEQLDGFKTELLTNIKSILATQAAEPLQKLDAASGALAKRFDEVAVLVDALKSRVDILEKAPINMGPVLREVPGASGGESDVTLSAMDELIKVQTDPMIRQSLMNQRTEMALKAVHRGGGHRVG